MIAPTIARHCVRLHFVRIVLHFVLAISLGPLAGCITTRNMMSLSYRDPMAGAPRLKNNKNPRLEEVVSHLNRNTELVHSWRASRIRIHAQGVAIPLQGRLAVERGNHVRLEVTSPRGGEVDIGSNDQQFWVWSREMKPAFVTCKHENTEVVRRSYGIPFETEWLMEALGVAPIPTDGMTLETSPSKNEMRLVQQVVTARGHQLRRALLIDLKKGGVITEHSLYDYDGHRIAIAKLGAHYYDKPSGAVLPHRVSLDWPRNQMAVTMEFGKIEVNPSSIPSQVWDLPVRRDCEMVELDADMSAAKIAAAKDRSVVHINSIEDVPNGDDEGYADQDRDLPARQTAHAGHARISSSDTDETQSKSGWARFFDESEEEPAE